MRLERDPGCLHSWDNALASSAVKGLISWRTSSGITQILLVFLQTFLQLAGTGSTQGAGALVISQSCRNSLESRDCVQGWVQGVSRELPGTDRSATALGGCKTGVGSKYNHVLKYKSVTYFLMHF